MWNPTIIQTTYTRSSHLVRNSTSARFEKKPFNIHLVQIYSTSVSEKNYVFSKNSIDTNFALSE